MLERVDLFSNKKDLLYFITICLAILIHSLFLEYKKYEQLARFDTFNTTAVVQNQYLKSNQNRTYTVLKLKSLDGYTLYSIAKKDLQNIKNKKIDIEVTSKDFTFYNFISSFFGFTKIEKIYDSSTTKDLLSRSIQNTHRDSRIAQIYNALFLAQSVDYEVQQIFANLGISHLIAISGFHLGILSAIILFSLRPIYYFFQARYFPYSNSKLHLFVVTFLALFAYLLFLDAPPSLERSLGMFVVGFILYDRGIKVISMQTLLLTLLLLLSFFPRLFFSLGFWLSAGGVYYIFLFMHYFKEKGWLFLLVGISGYVYFAMVPISNYIFGNFSLFHALSIPLSILFSIFYPLSIFLHIIGYGDALDPILIYLLDLGSIGGVASLKTPIYYAYLLSSLLALYKRWLFYASFLFALGIFVASVYEVV